MVVVRIMDETPSTAVQITAPVNQPQDPHLSEQQLVELARAMVEGIKDPEDVLPDFNITQEQFDTHIMTNGYFKRAYQALLIEWNGASSTHKRLALKSAAVLEDSLHKVGARMVDAKETLTAVVEAGKFFAKLAGAGEERERSAGEKFSINITIGDQTVKLDAQRTPEIIPAEIQALPKGAGS